MVTQGGREASLTPDFISWERTVHLPRCPERVLWWHLLGLGKAALWDSLGQGDPKMKLNAIFIMG